MSKQVPVSFKCTKCHQVMTFGVVGGRNALSEPPPCCLYCGNEELEETDEHLDLEAV